MKPKTLLPMLGLLAGLTVCPAPPLRAAAPQSMPTAPGDIDFDAGWRFSLSDVPGAANAPFDDAAWQTVSVPHDWSSDGPFGPQYGSGNGFAPGGIGWYRKHFSLGANQQGKRVEIQFDGVYDNAEVWVNGQFVGRRPYGYIPFHYDLTPFLHFDGDNVVAVRVDHSRFADSRWYTGSGIYRNVRLHITSPLHIATWGTSVTTPAVTASSAGVRVETTVVNDDAKPQAYSVQTDVLDSQGRVVATRTSGGSLRAGTSGTTEQTETVARPALWSPATPARYHVHTRLSVGGVVQDDSTTFFGIRTLKYDPDRGLLLNGVPIKIKGVCIHHDAGPLGAAVPDGVLERRLRLLQGLGVNAIRTSHNPPGPELLEMCDRLGLMVMEEAFDEWTPSKNKWVQGRNNGQPSKFGYAEFFAEWGVRDVEDMVRRDRSHPSVIMWSIGNEIDYPNDPFSHPILGNSYRPQNPRAENMPALARPLIAAVKRMDPTRPVTMALAAPTMSDAVGLGAMLDIDGYNYMEALYPADHKKYPKRVLFGSENSQNYAAWTAVRDNAYVAGQFLWTGIDYLGEANAWPNRASGAGLLDLCGFAKPLAYFRQSLWSDRPMVYLCAAPASTGTAPAAPAAGGPGGFRRRQVQERWNWPTGSTVTVSCYTNCPAVALTLNGRALGAKRQTDAVDGVLTWTIPYEPGTLRAVGLRGDQSLVSFALQTAGVANRLLLLPDTATLTADGKSVAHVEFRVVDAQGVRVLDAAPEVTFTLSGPATLLGIGNGDVNDPQSGRGLTHHAFQGRGLAILQAADTPGPITLTATAPGLLPATVTLTSR